MKEEMQIRQAVEAIKEAILQGQYEACKGVTRIQLAVYFGMRLFYENWILLDANSSVATDELKSTFTDYTKPMGVATYKTADEMPENFRKALPDTEALKKLLNESGKEDKV